MSVSDESAPPEEQSPAPAPASDDPETVRALARETLAWCRENAADPEALPRLNTVLQLVHDPALAADALSAAQAVTRPVLADPEPSPAVHAHMTVLLSLLIDYERTRDAVDLLFAEWLRHPKSYGPAHATPTALQRAEFVQRLGDLLGWSTLDVKRDRDALSRFAHWVDTWTPRNKFRAKRAVDAVRRNFPAPGVWDAVRFPQGATGGGGHGPKDGSKDG